MTIPLLLTFFLEPEHVVRLQERGFDVLAATDAPARIEAIEKHGARIRVVLTNGSIGCSAQQIAALPALEIVCALGAGHENVDVQATNARGIAATHGPGTNAASVADHAMALLLASARNVVQGDAAVRRGEWDEARQSRPMVSGKKLGIVGLGHIGREIARRGAGGFDMPIGYFGRTEQAESPYRYFPTLDALAGWADFLVVAAPGGAATHHLIDAAVLKALGPHGFLVNIARGGLVDTEALVVALNEGRIAGAGLDVVEGEPAVPQALRRAANLTITPHLAGRSPEAVAATVALVLKNLAAHFGGRSVLTPIPGSLVRAG